MRSTRTGFLAVAAALVAVAWPAAGQAANGVVSLDADGAELQQVLLTLSEETGINVIADAEVAKQAVTILITNVTVEGALRALAVANNLEIDTVPGQDGIYIVRRRGARADSPSTVTRVGGPATTGTSLVSSPTSPVRSPGGAPAEAAGASLPTQPTLGARPHTAGGASRRTGERLIRVKIPVSYSFASDIAAFFKMHGIPSAATLLQNNYAAWVGVDLGQTTSYHVPSDWGVPAGTVRRDPRMDRQIRDSDAVLSLARNRYAGDRDQYGRRYSRDQFGDGGVGPGGGGGGLGGLGAGGGLGGGGLGGAGQGVFELPEGIEELVGLDMISALIVRGEPGAIEELRELVELLDVPPKQIEVESRFVNLTVSEADALGITWTVTNGTFTVEGSTPSGGGASVAMEYLNGNAQALLTAIRRENAGKVVNAPKVATQNGQPAIVAFQQDIPVTVSDTITTDAASTVSTQIIPVPVTTALLVVPRVTGQPPNESITTVVSPQIEDVIGFVDNPSGGTIPITSTQQVQTMLRVPDGGTIALGGLIRKNNSQDTIKIPFLGDLPLIGVLFRSKRLNVDESELIVFVTPTILRDPSANEGPAVVL